MNWYPIFLREILIFERRLMRLGYVMSAILMPLLYLLAFGLGLGRRVNIAGGSYLNYLLPGLVAMSSMINSFTWVANGLTMGRLYFQTFQGVCPGPGECRGHRDGPGGRGDCPGPALLPDSAGAGAGHRQRLAVQPDVFPLPGAELPALRGLGAVVGMRSKTHEDTANFSNFFIMPMAFFSGTFFPIQQMPRVLQIIVGFLPLTHTNLLLRDPVWDLNSLASLGVMVVYTALFLTLAIALVRRYSE